MLQDAVHQSVIQRSKDKEVDRRANVDFKEVCKGRPDEGDTLQVRANVNNGDVAKATTVRGKVFEKSLVVGVEGEAEDHKAIRPTQYTCCQAPGLL